MDDPIESSELDISLAAGQVVSNALQNSRNLFCPFCAEGFVFESTLKDHIKNVHRDLIEEHSDQSDLLSLTQQFVHSCPYCGACFKHFGLIPKHISCHHGNKLLKLWQDQSGIDQRLQEAKTSEPTILYAACSPGLSDIFTNMTTKEPSADAEDIQSQKESPTKLKSILKKTPSKSKGGMSLVYSPSSAKVITIRRSKSNIVKRSLSARRELHFDPNTKLSPTIGASAAVAALSPKNNLHHKHPFRIRNLFPFSWKTKSNNGASSAANNKLITSTPINWLDDAAGPSTKFDARKTWKASVRNSQYQQHMHRRLSYDLDQFQCACCKKSWENNADLLMHLREHHKGFKHWLRPQYGCSTCGATFYSNNYLIRHCHIAHFVGVGGSMERGVPMRHSVR